mgnify:FL=1
MLGRKKKSRSASRGVQVAECGAWKSIFLKKIERGWSVAGQKKGRGVQVAEFKSRSLCDVKPANHFVNDFFSSPPI